jgi:hypothetical protein
MSLLIIARALVDESLMIIAQMGCTIDQKWIAFIWLAEISGYQQSFELCKNYGFRIEEKMDL